jgi:SUMO ligase MMS21 Smc5/6 complex component
MLIRMSVTERWYKSKYAPVDLTTEITFNSETDSQSDQPIGVQAYLKLMESWQTLIQNYEVYQNTRKGVNFSE